ncbi:MAG: CDP-alcohol phosphatidyltransferase family protein [Candidatus Micrarchaeia archaeon]
MLKKSFSNFQEKLGEMLKPIPLHPNHITALSVLFAGAGTYFAFGGNLLAIPMFAISFALDAIDGAIARAKGLTSKFGAYMDGICDRLVEFLALLPLFLFAEFVFPALITLFFGTCMTSFSKAYASHREIADNKEAAQMKTIMPRAERVIAILIVLALFLYGEVMYAWYLLWAVAAVSVISFIFLQFEARRISKEK